MQFKKYESNKYNSCIQTMSTIIDIFKKIYIK